MSLQESGEMYLETIHVLSKKNANVRAVDIGEELGYSRPSVSRAMHILKDEGFITIDDTGSVRLTKAGQKIASRIYERHTVLTRLFINLGVNEKTASDDACRIEHYISDESFKAIKKHMAQFCPNHQMSILASLRHLLTFQTTQ